MTISIPKSLSSQTLEMIMERALDLVFDEISEGKDAAVKRELGHLKNILRECISILIKALIEGDALAVGNVLKSVIRQHAELAEMAVNSAKFDVCVQIIIFAVHLVSAVKDTYKNSLLVAEVSALAGPEASAAGAAITAIGTFGFALVGLYSDVKGIEKAWAEAFPNGLMVGSVVVSRAEAARNPNGVEQRALGSRR